MSVVAKRSLISAAAELLIYRLKIMKQCTYNVVSTSFPYMSFCIGTMYGITSAVPKLAGHVDAEVSRTGVSGVYATWQN